jgi:hypothetical protein
MSVPIRYPWVELDTVNVVIIPLFALNVATEVIPAE